MRILIVGESGRPHELAGALEAAGVDVEGPPESALGGASQGEGIGELATALIALERRLADDPPDAVLLVSASDLALAAVLVAAKLQVPVAALADAASQERMSQLNSRLIVQLADGTVGGDAATIAASLRDLIDA